MAALLLGLGEGVVNISSLSPVQSPNDLSNSNSNSKGRKKLVALEVPDVTTLENENDFKNVEKKTEETPTLTPSSLEVKEGNRNRNNKNFYVGGLVEREIDSMWVPGRILEIHEDDGGTVYDVEYEDDGNIEADVPFSDIRWREGVENPGPQEEDVLRSPQNRHRAATSGKVSALTTAPTDSIPLHLKQLLEEEDREKGETTPRVTIGREDGEASAYIINGAETNIAAGSGLRALRWLRN